MAQTSSEQRIDSLTTVLISLEKSTKKADVLNEIANSYPPSQYRKALTFAQKSLALAEELNYDRGIFIASENIGHIYTHFYLNYFEASQHLSRALEIAEEKGGSNHLLQIYTEYAYLKHMMGSYKDAIRYNQKAIQIVKDREDYDRLALLYARLGDIYFDSGDKKNALDYYSLTFALYNSDKVEKIYPDVYLSVAMYYRMNGKYEQARALYERAIYVFKEEQQPRFESLTYARLGETLLRKGQIIEAITVVDKGIIVANENNLTKEKLDNYTVQIAAFDSLGDYKKTYVSLIKYTKFKDSIVSSQYFDQNQKFQSSYEQMLNQTKLEQLKEQQQIQELALENQRLNRNIIIGILFFAVILVLLMILRLRYIRKKERELRVLSLATSHTTNSIILFDKDICVEWVNKGFERLTSRPLHEVKGLYFLEFYNGPHLSKEKEEELKSKFKSGKPFTMELQSIHRDTSEKYWISFSVTPLFENDIVRGYVSVATDITEIHKAQVALQRSHDQTIVLNEIGRQITSTLSVSEIIEKVYENVNKLMDAENLGVGIVDEKNNQLLFPEPIERGNKLGLFSYPLADEERLAVKCFKNNREIRVGNEEEILAVTGSNPSPIAGGQPKSVIYVPLMAKWKTMGVFSVQSFKENAYSESDMDVVRALATYVAIAIENATLYETLEERVVERTKEVTAQKEQLEVNYENIKLLSEIGVEISSSLNFEDIFDTFYETVTKLMDAEIFGVRLYHEDQQEIEYKYEIESGKRDPVITVPMSDKDNYSVWCVENKKEIWLNDNMNEYHKYVNEIKVPSGEVPNSLIFYPMIAEEKVLGVITVQSFKKNAYSPYHVAMVKTLSSYSAAALSNKKLYDTLELKVEQRTEELAQKNKDIMASINYARRIQHGILPTEHFIQQLLPESFIFYRPRDVISGDFYWVERRLGKIYFAVVDCTGHGVPGALMSIIGKNILDQAVNEKEIEDPSMVLTFLRAGLRVAFSADETEEGSEVEDGMDLAVCIWDVDDRTISFSGANSNLYLIHDGALEVIKGEKSGVSASNFDMRNYTSHTMEIMKGDTVYLSSDGFPDQFGGDKTKKYSQRRFQEFLLKLSSLPIKVQQLEVEKELRVWQGELDQLDDICVMGVKF
ncbi:MAG: GAF domain-containing protein [Crocinitomicaceae bacterium]